MKTITEYQPMIFSKMAANGEKRILLRRQLGIDGLMALGYSVPGLWLSFDTGFVVWHWQFWLVFAPIFFAGELAIHAFRHGERPTY
jgi:hypothetical protein